MIPNLCDCNLSCACFDCILCGCVGVCVRWHIKHFSLSSEIILHSFLQWSKHGCAVLSLSAVQWRKLDWFVPMKFSHYMSDVRLYHEIDRSDVNENVSAMLCHVCVCVTCLSTKRMCVVLTCVSTSANGWTSDKLTCVSTSISLRNVTWMCNWQHTLLTGAVNSLYCVDSFVKILCDTCIVNIETIENTSSIRCHVKTWNALTPRRREMG